MIGTILLFIAIAWVVSILLSITIIITEDAEAESKVVFLFPANLIFVIKYWWGAIVEAIKS